MAAHLYEAKGVARHQHLLIRIHLHGINHAQPKTRARSHRIRGHGHRHRDIRHIEMSGWKGGCKAHAEAWLGKGGRDRPPPTTPAPHDPHNHLIRIHAAAQPLPPTNPTQQMPPHAALTATHTAPSPPLHHAPRRAEGRGTHRQGGQGTGGTVPCGHLPSDAAGAGVHSHEGVGGARGRYNRRHRHVQAGQAGQGKHGAANLHTPTAGRTNSVGTHGATASWVAHVAWCAHATEHNHGDAMACRGSKGLTYYR